MTLDQLLHGVFDQGIRDYIRYQVARRTGEGETEAAACTAVAATCDTQFGFWKVQVTSRYS